MNPPPDICVVSADRTRHSVLVTFEDGKCALYSSRLLYALLGQAEQVLDPEGEDGPVY